MRLHRLTLRAFGSFADEIDIDFDALGADGLFLLHGQTGAGKTTILDAVAFALYGQVPGARRTGKRLRSDHAAADDVPQVMLEATLAGRRIRITRSPEFHRPKKRGDGLRKINAAATLVYLDRATPDLTRLVDIGDAVARMLGMSADQFFQVVLLPQGEFARFLRAESDERQQLLERLFDTERFGDLEEWLRERAKDSAADLAEKEAFADRLAGQIVAVGGGEQPAEPDVDWAAGRLAAAREHARISATELAAAQAAAERAIVADDAAKKLADLRRRGREAQAVLDRL
ncbi:MAG: SMC family ATPase, partial [Gordonia sp. (in: high G+C Gram-positive bacteria)]